MSLSEVAWRITGWRRRQHDRRELRRAGRRPLAALGMRAHSGAERLELHGLVPGTSSAQIASLRGIARVAMATMERESLASAARVLDGTWTRLGWTFDLRGTVPWHRDPRTGFEWNQREFAGDIDIRTRCDEVDVKYTWEIGRHQFIVDLAKAWALGGHACPLGAGCAARARSLVLDWIQRNPVNAGIHWTSALEVSIRAVSWLWTIAFLAEWEGWESDDRGMIAQSLRDHASYLSRHLSLFSSPYNHLIGEAVGLYLMALALPSLDAGERWRRLGREMLLIHGPRQFYKDGFSVEQSTTYHYFTLGFLAMAIVAARNHGEPLHELEPIVHRAFRAGIAFRQPDGRWPRIGDSDSARAIPISHADFFDFTSISHLGALLFDDPELVASNDPGEEAIWLLGADGLVRWTGGGIQTGHPDDGGIATTANGRGPLGADGRCAILGESGYFIANRGTDWLLLDSGRVAEGLFPDSTPSVAHGHLDTLQVLYWLNGLPVVQDCGIPFYSGRPDWISHFRGCGAHNTIAIDGTGPATSAGALAWCRSTGTPSLYADYSTDAWFACGRARWGRGVVIQRNLFCIPGQGLWIADWVHSPQLRGATWYWQLPAENVPTGGDAAPSPGQYVWDDRAIIVCAVMGADDGKFLCVDPGGTSPVSRLSPCYGEVRASRRLEFRVLVRNEVVVATYLGRKRPKPPNVSLAFRDVKIGFPLGCGMSAGSSESPHEVANRHDGQSAMRDQFGFLAEYDLLRWTCHDDRGLVEYSCAPDKNSRMIVTRRVISRGILSSENLDHKVNAVDDAS